MSSPIDDEISRFYTDHPYPPPVLDLGAERAAWSDGLRRRLRHHLLWPTRPPGGEPAVLVAGCGTSQAARHAVRAPGSEVVGIDVSPAAIDASTELADRHGLDNLELHLLPIEEVPALGRTFDLIVCTGVLHHLDDPLRGLRALGEALAPGGALLLMVYGSAGRVGIAMLREYCRRLEIRPTAQELADLVATLGELPVGHPLSHLLRTARDFRDADALADALLNPRERSYSVPELLGLVEAGGLRFARWWRQAPYLPHCGALTETPHGRRIAGLAPEEQYAAVELFRGDLARHTAILHRVDGAEPVGVDWAGERWRSFVPVRPPEVIVVEERLPAGVAGAVINRRHTATDLVLFLTPAERAVFEAVDGRRTIGELAPEGPDLFRRLWWHDHVVVDASGAAGTTGAG
ncbi:MAG: class I SAM-dependent methyltransferase [Actinomycetota bacterium]